jgi:arsenate reductase
LHVGIFSERREFHLEKQTSPQDAQTLTEQTSKERIEWHFAGQPVRLLFLCKDNGARSQIAETLVRHLSQGQVDVLSAGSQPAEKIEPEAIPILTRLGADLRQQVPKPLDPFLQQSFDRVIVISEQASEEFPHLPENCRCDIWNIPAPSAVSQSSEEPLPRLFERLTIELTMRIRLLFTLLEREKRGELE